MQRTVATLATMALVVLTPAEASLSGATIESITGRYFKLTLSTPSISFAPNPETGETEEMEFHAEASRTFKAHLARVEKPLTAHLDKLRKLPAWEALIPYDPKLPMLYDWERERMRGACRVSMFVTWRDMAELEVAMRSPPSEEQVAALRKAIEVVLAKDVAADDWP